MIVEDKLEHENIVKKWKNIKVVGEQAATKEVLKEFSSLSGEKRSYNCAIYKLRKERNLNIYINEPQVFLFQMYVENSYSIW